MLMRSEPPVIEDDDDIAAGLNIPAKPDSLVRAEAAWREAVDARERAQSAHIEAVRLHSAQLPGQPATITVREVDDIALTLGPAFAAEDTAKTLLDAERAGYEQDVKNHLRRGLDVLCLAVAAKTEELDRLLDAGAACHAAAAVARVRLPNSIAPRCRDVRSHIQSIRRALEASRS